MIKLIEKMFESVSNTDNQVALSQQELNVATAALLIEVAVIDQDFDQSEQQQLQKLLMAECELTDTEAATLIEEAKEASANSSSLYDFTQLINRHCDYQQKLSLVSGLWKIAYADGELDKYEEHIIRRITDLIHVSHRDFIQVKIQVRDRMENNK